MAEMSLFNSIGIAAIGVLYVLQAQPAASQERRGVIPHAPLLKTVLPDTANLEVAVYEIGICSGRDQPPTLASGGDHFLRRVRFRHLARGR